MDKLMRRYWTTDETDLLRALYQDTPTKEIATRIGRTLRQVYMKASDLGLRKSDEYMAGPHSCRLRRGDNVGAQHRFTKGHATWNKGKHFVSGGRSVETRFKKCQGPHNTARIGDERITDDGYIERKIADTGNTRKDWVGIHRIVWTEHNGPVPAGHVVVFRNGNIRDARIENLELITRAELMRRNTVHRYPKELVSAIRLNAGLRRRIKRKEREKQDSGLAQPSIRDA